jgi:predicted esterase YcpF (UPF0227 family)
LSVVRNCLDMYLYLHGFNSSGASSKGRFLTEALSPSAVHAPSYPAEPAAAITYLRHTIEELQQLAHTADPLILIGSSLGGYYAQYLAHQYRVAMVLINPALQPLLTLRPYLGWQTNFYSGARYYFDEPQLTSLRHYDIAEPCTQAVPALLLLDAGDEIIDYRVAQQRYAACAQVCVFPGGNHQFQHLAQAADAITTFTLGIM